MHAYDSLETPIKINSWYEESERKKSDYGVRRSVMVSTQNQTDPCPTQQNFNKAIEAKLTPKPRFSKLCHKTDMSLLSKQVSLEIEEFSQDHLGEQIVDYDVLTEEEILAQFDKDNDYLTSWTTEQKINYIRDWKSKV